ncbi:TRAP transporter permease [Natronorubrum sp. FCH18a]|uniref:TRAP transporter permease n=1 Tax=Natronorubrum sp. FCH18a TaxID=3447018 RepID=UPI003F519582
MDTNSIQNDQSTENLIFVSLVILFWSIVIGYAHTTIMLRGQLAIIFISLSAIIYCFSNLYLSDEDILQYDRWLLNFALLLSASSMFYLLYNYTELTRQRIGYATDIDYIFAIMVIVFALYLVYREYGLAFPLIVLVAGFYAYFGTAFPGVFRHAGIGGFRILQISVTEMDGIFGSLTQVVAAWVALFFLWAGLMQSYGAFNLIFGGASKVAKYSRSGIAMMAVVGSMAMATINGSATANTGITGNISIPLMKESGMSPESSAAVEATASNGGQIMPPIMGASAFLMASLLGISYWDVVIAAFIPGVIYFVSIMIAVHYTALRELDSETADRLLENIDTIADDEGPATTSYPSWIDLLRFTLPVVVMIYYLGVAEYSIPVVGLYTVISMIVFGCGIPIIYDRSRETIKGTLLQTIDGLVIGAKIIAPIALIVAVLNLAIDLLMATGTPSALTLALLDLSGGVLEITLVLALIICILLGMGMPTIAAYLIVAILIAPTIVRGFQIPDLAAHFFVLYAANLSTITPPIAASVVVATGIAGSNFWRTCVEAVRISAPIFVIPFMFIYRPEIITADITTGTLVSGVFGLAGAISLAIGLNYPGENMSWYTRVLIGIVLTTLGILLMIWNVPIYNLLLVIIAATVFLTGKNIEKIRSFPTVEKA